MRRTMPNKRFVLAVLPLLLVGAVVQAETDSGAVSRVPWSGYWWQHRSGGLTGPLGKYDRVVGTTAAAWERQTHVSPNVPAWFGHCHAWSAACVSEKEPTRGRTVSNVPFSVGDEKGLLCACHDQDVANSYGDRYGDGAGLEDRLDINPVELWRLLQMYVKQRNLPLILDLEAGEQVWNYPVYQYRVKYSDSGNGWYDATMELVTADNNVEPDYVGTESALHTFTFRFQFQGGALVTSSGQWTGESVEDHPDFAWYPYVAVAENPEVRVEEVARIVGYAVGGSNPPDVDGNPTDGPNLAPPSNDNPPDNGTRPPADPGGPTDPRPPIDPQSTTEPNQADQVVSWQSILSPDELIALIANKTSSFALDAFVDQGDGGRYQVGQPITVSFRSGAAGYLYVFDVGPKGQLTLVFPLPGQGNRVKKDKLYDIPWENEEAWFVATRPGQHDLKVIVTPKRIALTGFSQMPFSPHTDQASDKQKLKQKQKPTQTTGQHSKQRIVKQKPREMVIYPTARRRVFRRLFRVFRKGMPAEQTPENGQQTTQKVTGFAQDICSYFVLSNKGKQKPK